MYTYEEHFHVHVYKVEGKAEWDITIPINVPSVPNAEQIRLIKEAAEISARSLALQYAKIFGFQKASDCKAIAIIPGE